MTGRDWLRWACFAGIAALYIASVPWYRDGGDELVLWLGLPDWAAVALLCYVGVALLNTVAWRYSDLPDDPATLEPPSPSDERTSGRPGPRP